MPFEVCIGSVVVGCTDLESGDPAMGVVHGVFRPNTYYSEYRRFADEDGFLRPDAEVLVRNAEGKPLQPNQGTFIQDFSTIQADDFIEVSILGLHDYETWFPGRYGQGLKKSDSNK